MASLSDCLKIINELLNALNKREWVSECYCCRVSTTSHSRLNPSIDDEINQNPGVVLLCASEYWERDNQQNCVFMGEMRIKLQNHRTHMWVELQLMEEITKSLKSAKCFHSRCWQKSLRDTLCAVSYMNENIFICTLNFLNLCSKSDV